MFFFWLFIDDDDLIRKVENSTFTDFCAISAISFGLCVSILILVWLKKNTPSTSFGPLLFVRIGSFYLSQVTTTWVYLDWSMVFYFIYLFIY